MYICMYLHIYKYLVEEAGPGVLARPAFLSFRILFVFHIQCVSLM